MSPKLSLFPGILRKANTWKWAESLHNPQNCNHRSIYTDLWFSLDLYFFQKSRQSPSQLSLNCLPKNPFFISTETHHFRTFSCSLWAGIHCSCQSLASTHCIFRTCNSGSWVSETVNNHSFQLSKLLQTVDNTNVSSENTRGLKTY